MLTVPTPPSTVTVMVGDGWLISLVCMLWEKMERVYVRSATHNIGTETHITLESEAEQSASMP